MSGSLFAIPWATRGDSGRPLKRSSSRSGTGAVAGYELALPRQTIFSTPRSQAASISCVVISTLLRKLAAALPRPGGLSTVAARCRRTCGRALEQPAISSARLRSHVARRGTVTSRQPRSRSLRDDHAAEETGAARDDDSLLRNDVCFRSAIAPASLLPTALHSPARAYICRSTFPLSESSRSRTSASTMMRTRSRNFVRGAQPSFRRALVASPSRQSISVGR